MVKPGKEHAHIFSLPRASKPSLSNAPVENVPNLNIWDVCCNPFGHAP